MHVMHQDSPTKGQFYIDIDGHTAAAMTYVWVGVDRIIIDHTEVSTALRGQGAGLQLVTQAVHWAREQGLRVLPLCPFARSVFDKHPEFHDVLAS